MHKLFTTAALALALLATSMPFASPASAEGIEVTDICPELTDSVDRLYSAYFLRSPDNSGIDFWLTEYSEGRWSLAEMSQFFSGSDEFVSLYGPLSNRQFVNLIYQNILGRAGEASGVEFWTDRLDNGAMNRGQVMLAFSEGPEYVRITGTAPPMAGYYQSYPEGATWYCGTQSREIDFSPGTSFYADGFAELGPDGSGPWIAINTIDATGDDNSLLMDVVLGPDSYVFFWDGQYDLRPEWQETEKLAVSRIRPEETELRWAIVLYPTSIGNVRGGLGDIDTVGGPGGSLVGGTHLGCTNCF